MRRSVTALGVALFALLLGACTSATLEYRRAPRKARTTSHSSLGIPPGHLPPPGSCRIWYPGTPPGHQPPPGDCAALARDVPAGAWLLHRPSNEPQHVDVSVYDPKRPRVVVEIRIFEASTGTFIGIRGQSSSR
jgi:hypothetical protein